MTTTDTTARQDLVGTIVHLPLTQIRMTGLNPRLIAEDELEDLDTLATYQHHPVTVFPSPKVEGDFELIDGHRRLTAARRLGLDTLRCEVVEAPSGDADLIMDMLTVGTSGKALSTAEIADGIQGVLDLGVSLDDVQRRTGRGKRVKQRAYWEKQEGAQESLDAAFSLLAARELLDGDEDALAELDKAAGRGAEEVNRIVDREMAARDRDAVVAFMKDTDAVETPASRKYAYDVTPEYVEASAYLDGNQVEVADEIDARVRVGQTYEVVYGGQVKWTPAAAKKAAAEAGDDEVEESEPTPEEIAAAAARDQAATDLATLRKASTDCLVAAFKKKSPLQALRAHAALQEEALEMLTHAVEHTTEKEYRALILEVLGLPGTKDPDQFEEHIYTPARKLFKEKTWEWLVAFNGLDEFISGAYAMGQLKHAALPYYEGSLWKMVSTLEDRYGLSVPEAKASLHQWLHHDEARDAASPGDGTAECEACGQTVSTDQDWDGVCDACAEQDDE